jgi:hypothetical protein
MFPSLTTWLPPLQFAAILSTTRLVGTLCPGLNSIYSELNLNKTTQEKNTTLKYKVKEFDKRFGLVFMDIAAPGLKGFIKALRRPGPQEQANFLTMKRHVMKNEFANQRALIIGGSRGLGEVAAKLLAAGGADVKITYNLGADDARFIVDDIVSNGGIADCFHFNVLNPNLDAIIKNWSPTHLYYFATPVISPGTKGKFSHHLFNKFCNYYIAGFINTVNLLRDLEIKGIFYPSTIYVDELPTNMGEYSVAKIASETLCCFLEKSIRGLKIYKPRLPRMATDQTVSIIPADREDPVTIMIKELRSFQDS